MTRTEQKIRKIFAANKALRVLFYFPDGNIFSDKVFALNHQRACKRNMVIANREDFTKPASKPIGKLKSGKQKKSTPAKAAKPEKSKNEVLTLRDQLAGLDLENPEGPMYNTYKQLRDGLGIVTIDNKMATIVAALAEEQKKLKSQKPE